MNLKFHHSIQIHLDEECPDALPTEESTAVSEDSANSLPIYCCKTCNIACSTPHRFNQHTCHLSMDDSQLPGVCIPFFCLIFFLSVKIYGS